jgi:hypothetical protein
VIAVAAVVAVVALWLLLFDVSLFLRGNLALFDETLNAEATAVLAIVAVLGGLYAAYREFVVRKREPLTP